MVSLKVAQGMVELDIPMTANEIGVLLGKSSADVRRKLSGVRAVNESGTRRWRPSVVLPVISGEAA
mgnify:CR=1 FL=1